MNEKTLINETTEKLLKQQKKLRILLGQTQDADVLFTTRYFLSSISAQLSKKRC